MAERVKRPKLVRDDSGERAGWWLNDRFVPDEPPGVREWHQERRAKAALEGVVKSLREQHLRPWRQGAYNNLGCDCCGISWEEPAQEHHSTACIVGSASNALAALDSIPREGGG
jgi:hypothetical protein